MKVKASDLKVGDRVREENVFDFDLQDYVGPKVREVTKVDRSDRFKNTIDIHFADGGASLCDVTHEFDLVTETQTLDWSDWTHSPLQVLQMSYNAAGEVTLLIRAVGTGTTVRVMLVQNELSKSLVNSVTKPI